MKPFDVVEWMAENGHPSYKKQIQQLQSLAIDALCEEHCLEYMERIEEIRREAQDRYDDWKTDPLE